MDKGGVLGGQPLFRWEKLRKSLILKNSLSAPLIYRLNTRSIQILKGLNLRDTEHAFDESAAFFEIDTIALVDFTKRGASDFRETALNGFLAVKDEVYPTGCKNCEMIFHNIDTFPFSYQLSVGNRSSLLQCLIFCRCAHLQGFKSARWQACRISTQNFNSEFISGFHC